ncbi:MAG: MoaD/ThiS family protein [Cetobacterium sp.]|uniref:MoaD/ThiS family protein n=1 Tax=Cetobacterium sp. TaxID=2071632 RepID=UPI003F2A679B
MLEIRFFATLRYGRENIIKIPFYQDITGTQLLKLFNISQDQVSIFLINGFHCSLDTKLCDEDVISIFPPVGGG